MTENEKKLLSIIRDYPNPEIALLLAIEIILDFLSNPMPPKASE